MPRKVKMRREVGGAVEEYLDYLFPDDEKKMGELPLCCIECFIGVEASACLVVVVVVVVVVVAVIVVVMLKCFGGCLVGMKILEKALEWKKMAALMNGASVGSSANAEEISIDEVEEEEDKAFEESSLLGKRKNEFDE